MICHHCKRDCIEMDKATTEKLKKRTDVVCVCPTCWESLIELITILHGKM